MDDSYLGEILRVQFKQLDDRISEQSSDLRQRIDELRARQEEMTGALMERLDKHDHYHRKHEHQWGLIRLASRHPFRVTAITVGFLMAFGWIEPEAAEHVFRLVAKLVAGN